MSFGRFFAALCEQVPDLAFRFTQPHVEHFRPFDAEEEFGMVLAGLLANLEAQVVRRGLAEQRLAAAGRAVEEKAFRDRMIKPFEQFRVQERQFDGIADALHGFLLATDVLPENRLHACE